MAGLGTTFAMPRSATALEQPEELKDKGVARLLGGGGVVWEGRVGVGGVGVIGLVLVRDIADHVSSRRARTKAVL